MCLNQLHEAPLTPEITAAATSIPTVTISKLTVILPYHHFAVTLKLGLSLFFNKEKSRVYMYFFTSSNDSRVL